MLVSEKKYAPGSVLNFAYHLPSPCETPLSTDFDRCLKSVIIDPAVFFFMRLFGFELAVSACRRILSIYTVVNINNERCALSRREVFVTLRN